MQFIFGNVPPQESGGFHFPQRLASGDFFQLTASTKDELDRAVMDFRVRNSLPIGDPPRETNEYLCAKWPHYCKPDDPIEADESPASGNLRQRTTNWRVNRYSQSHTNSTLVDEETAESRATICSTCPYNQDNREGCPPCVGENDRVLFMLREGRSVKAKVGGCAITAQDNVTASFFPKARLSYARKFKDQLPQHCWLLKEI